MNVPVPIPAAGTQMLGEPTLTLDYSGTATNSDGRLYAQILSGANGQTRGNQVTPIPVDARRRRAHDHPPREAVAAADVAPGSSSGVAGGRPAPGSFRCTAPAGRIAGRSLGPVRLGMTRTQARRPFRRVDTRGRRTMDFFCPTHGGIRVGYASPALAAALPRSERARTRGRVVLILTANSHYALRGLRPGAGVAAFERRLRLGHAFSVGRNQWYVAPDGAGRVVLKARHGRVQEIGIASASFARSRRSTARSLRSFP